VQLGGVLLAALGSKRLGASAVGRRPGQTPPVTAQAPQGALPNTNCRHVVPEHAFGEWAAWTPTRPQGRPCVTPRRTSPGKPVRTSGGRSNPPRAARARTQGPGARLEQSSGPHGSGRRRLRSDLTGRAAPQDPYASGQAELARSSWPPGTLTACGQWSGTAAPSRQLCPPTASRGTDRRVGDHRSPRSARNRLSCEVRAPRPGGPWS
jgi:hypothetical protein